MKRFYCTVCKKVKRVQKWPVNLINRESIHAEQRIGECNRHREWAKQTLRKVAR